MWSYFNRLLISFLVLLVSLPPLPVGAQGSDATFKPEEIDALVAPIALYPDALVSQILIASTYPLEIVQADRFAKQNPSLKGDALTKALEAQSWDPSVKSLVNFPQVLTMMNEKLDWTQKLGDAFLEQQKDVMDTIQSLRERAQAAGNLKTTTEQKVIVEQKIIRIEPANPQVIYVPAYNPTVVYGVWPYPAYPPYYYYPPGYVAARSAFWFAAGVGLGAAWGYAWGSPNWRGGSVNYNYNQNININTNINRNRYATTLPAGGQGNWQHNAEHRKGVAYRDQATAQKYNRASTTEAAKSREAYRGRTDQVRQQPSGGGAQQLGNRQGAGQASGASGLGQRAGQQPAGGASGNRQGPAPSQGSANRGGAFQGIDRGGSSAQTSSNRGATSRQAPSGGGGGGGASRGGGGGASRGGGGGGGGGGRR